LPPTVAVRVEIDALPPTMAFVVPVPALVSAATLWLPPRMSLPLFVPLPRLSVVAEEREPVSCNVPF